MGVPAKLTWRGFFIVEDKNMAAAENVYLKYIAAYQMLTHGIQHKQWSYQTSGFSKS
jgi:hypothetical protein